MASAKKKAEEVQGTSESMLGLPGEGTQIAGGIESPIDPIITAPIETAQTTVDELAAVEEKSALSELGSVIMVLEGGSASGVATGDGSSQLGELPIIPVDNPADAKALKQPPCEKCTQERPCSVECWVAVGQSADDYDDFIARADARAKPEGKSKARPAHHNLDERPRKFKVWEHGSMEIDGITHKSGAIVELPSHVAEKIGCLQPHEE